MRVQRLDGDLVVEIADDGRGVDADSPMGVGLLSMEERAGELGGSCQVLPRPGGGTLVRAVLPTRTVLPRRHGWPVRRRHRAARRHRAGRARGRRDERGGAGMSDPSAC